MHTLRLEVVPDEYSGAGKLSDVIRCKAYYKALEDVEQFAPVPEVACAWLHKPITIEDTNNVALIDTVGCNLGSCWWCYQQGRSEEAVERAPQEVADDFLRVAADIPVWRISGGEPTLQPLLPELLAALLEAAGGNHIIWINTNGYEVSRIPVCWGQIFVELSIKGLTPELYAWNSGALSFGNPLQALRRLLAAGHMTFVNCSPLAPEDWGTEQKTQAMAGFCDGLKTIHRGLPLVVTWLEPKYYKWIPDWRPSSDARPYYDQWLCDQDYTCAELLTPQWIWARKITMDYRSLRNEDPSE